MDRLAPWHTIEFQSQKKKKEKKKIRENPAGKKRMVENGRNYLKVNRLRALTHTHTQAHTREKKRETRRDSGTSSSRKRGNVGRLSAKRKRERERERNSKV